MSTSPAPLGRIVSAVAALALLATIAGCSSTAAGGESSASPDGGTIVGGITRPASGTDPLTEFTQSSAYLTSPVLSGLIAIDAKGKLIPDAAIDWSSSDDARVWTVHLRTQKYLDGTPFDAALVVKALDKALDPAAPAAGVSGLHGLLSPGGTKAVNDHTVQFTLDTPYSNFAYSLAGIRLNWLPDSVKPGDYVNGKAGGTGQFLLKSYSPDSGVVFTKNPDYWDAKDIHVDELDLKFYDDDQAIALALQAGEIDFAPNLSAVSVPALKGNDAITVLSSPSSAHNAIRFNTQSVPFDDVRVRQAFADAIDREALVKTLFDGDADVANDNAWASIFPESKDVAAAVPQRKHDVKAAKALLAEAGHPDGLDVTLTIPDTAAVTALAQLVQSQLKEIGVTVTIDSLPEGDYYGSLDDAAAPWLSADFAITPWSTRTDPSALLRAAYVSGAIFNESHYSNPEFDQLVTQYDSEADADARSDLAVKIATIESNDVPAIIAYFSPGYRAVSTKVIDFPAGPVASTLNLAGVRIKG